MCKEKQIKNLEDSSYKSNVNSYSRKILSMKESRNK